MAVHMKFALKLAVVWTSNEVSSAVPWSLCNQSPQQTAWSQKWPTNLSESIVDSHIMFPAELAILRR